MALLPHLQGARQVTRIAQLRVRRAVERRDLDAAIRDVEMVLRLVRDLQPRGVIISELVAAAITQVAGAEMVTRLLASSELKVRDCDRLLKVLAEHEARSHDGYVEGLRGEYLVGRVTLEELVRHQRELAQRMGLKPGQSVAKAILEPRSPATATAADSAKPLPEDVDVRLAGTTPAELSRQVGEMSRFSRELLSLDGVPYAERLRKIASLKQSRGDDVLARVVERLQPAPNGIEAFFRGISRARATLHAVECLVALRRWQFSHRGSPRDLASVVKAAGMKTVPLDPYDGKAMKMAMLDGKPVIYSVGRDGKDDGGRKDSRLDMQAGDLLYRLPQVERRR